MLYPSPILNLGNNVPNVVVRSMYYKDDLSPIRVDIAEKKEQLPEVEHGLLRDDELRIKHEAGYIDPSYTTFVLLGEKWKRTTDDGFFHCTEVQGFWSPRDFYENFDMNQAKIRIWANNAGGHMMTSTCFYNLPIYGRHPDAPKSVYHAMG